VKNEKTLGAPQAAKTRIFFLTSSNRQTKFGVSNSVASPPRTLVLKRLQHQTEWANATTPSSGQGPPSGLSAKTAKRRKQPQKQGHDTQKRQFMCHKPLQPGKKVTVAPNYQ
jgi:hypothetical protein